MVADMRPFFYRVSCELNNFSNFCPLTTLIARNLAELSSSNCGVSHLHKAHRIDELITKIMSMHGVLDEIQDHAMWRLVDGVGRMFKYAWPFSRHNRAKH